MKEATPRLSEKMPEHSVRNNFLIWGSYDWSNLGQEWIPSQKWKSSFIKNILIPHIKDDTTILEIGPGAGEWTKELISLSNRLILVDIVPRCIEICKERFKNFEGIEYYVNEGNNLEFLEDNVVDLVFSMDVFVQISPEDVKTYIFNLSKKLSFGGIGIIHHSKNGVAKLGWRSGVTNELMKEYCNSNGLKVLDQITSWEDGKYEIWPGEDVDSITIFQKQ